ncbi:YcaO-like family protein [Streptomyces sp. DSM 44915]|uniref:YcaO-like family protein n=1 Tax=Streptomyces chisholmiae TaxID=3075540 RepID=A0ABU2JPR6_9ACTN|nr:YcaO-like family protein [Streptomyces sp. DSM 44915]MDT0266509.1 YcaO-like family protein [Streptomyces sp. DSM 44915]
MSQTTVSSRDPSPRHEQLVGDVVGLCGRPYVGLRGPGEARMGFLTVNDIDVRALGSVASYNGRGYDSDPTALRAGALCEAYERYGLLDLDDTRTRYASVAELRGAGTAHLSPTDLLSLPADAVRQGSFGTLPADDQPIQWVDGVSLGTGATVLLPARYCVMFGDDASNRASDEGHWYCATSNGAATATSPSGACLAGLFELLERDAFMLLWYHRLAFSHLTVDPASRLGGRLAAALTGCRLEYRLIDLTEVHGVPTVFAIVRGAAAGNVQYGVGAGTAGSVTEAVWRAIKEALGFYSLQRRELLAGRYRELRADEVRTFVEHPLYYMDSRNQAELGFLFADRPARPVPAEPPEWLTGPRPEVLRRVVAHLGGRGVDLYAVDLTPAEGAATGMFTYKVVSPQLIPLDSDHEARHLTNERLRNEPTRRGWRPDQPELADLNHVPHPFP